MSSTCCGLQQADNWSHEAKQHFTNSCVLAFLQADEVGATGSITLWLNQPNMMVATVAITSVAIASFLKSLASFPQFALINCGDNKDPSPPALCSRHYHALVFLNKFYHLTPQKFDGQCHLHILHNTLKHDKHVVAFSWKNPLHWRGVKQLSRLATELETCFTIYFPQKCHEFHQAIDGSSC